MPWLPLPDVEPSPPLRKPGDSKGTVGRPIRLKSNHFEVTMKNPNLTIVHYDVLIKDYTGTPKRLPKEKQLHVFEQMKKSYPKVFGSKYLAYDCEKSAYSVGSIPQLVKGRKFEYEVDFIEEPGRRAQKFTIVLEQVNMAHMSELMKSLKGNAPRKSSTIMQMLEVMFRHKRALEYTQVGRSFFSPDGAFTAPFDVGGGKEGVLGFFASLRPARWKDGSILLNLDVAHAAFYKPQSVLEYIKETHRYRDDDFNYPLETRLLSKLKKELKTLKVQVIHTPIKRTYRICDISPFGPKDQTFDMTTDNGQTKKMTVEAYTKKTYNRNCRYPYLNCLQMGNKSKSIFIPMEFCEIAKNQKVKGKLSDREMADFIRRAAIPPKERLQQIMDIRRKNNLSNDPVMRELNFSIADAPIETSGRVLPAPNLLMANKIKPDRGVWDPRGDERFNSTGELVNWAVINYDYRTKQPQIMKFIDNLCKMAVAKGMKVEKHSSIINSTGRYPVVTEDFKKLLSQYPELKLIICIIPKGGNLYAQIKSAGDTVHGVITQCILDQNVFKCQPMTIGNLLLKINAKLGGTHTTVGKESKSFLFNRPIMIMGADVNHPPANDTATPSLVAVVASWDQNAAKYNVEIRHQSHRTEIIQDLQTITKDLLIKFFQRAKAKPERIVMYRDGVSDSQFLEVLSYELKKMRAACLSLDKSYNPAITFICVQKRHHTRLFCSEKDGVGKSKNIPPGTTVDTDITHPTERDFFLCSHQGIQGTSKPTHYHVLWDDSDMTMDQLQLLSYSMCHTYSRCTRSVSIPTPAYYAHLAAFRAKVHLQSRMFDDSASYSSGEIEMLPDAEIQKSIRLEAKVINSKGMYFV